VVECYQRQCLFPIVSISWYFECADLLSKIRCSQSWDVSEKVGCRSDYGHASQFIARRLQETQQMAMSASLHSLFGMGQTGSDHASSQGVVLCHVKQGSRRFDLDSGPSDGTTMLTFELILRRGIRNLTSECCVASCHDRGRTRTRNLEVRRLQLPVFMHVLFEPVCLFVAHYFGPGNSIPYPKQDLIFQFCPSLRPVFRPLRAMSKLVNCQPARPMTPSVTVLGLGLS